MGSEVPHLQTALPRNLRVCCAVIAPAMAHEPFSRWKRTSRGPRRLVENILVVAVVTLTLLAIPARGRRVFSAFSSPELRLPSFERLPRRSKEAVTTVVRRSTSTAAPPPEFVRMACAASGTPRHGGLGSMARGNKIRSPWLSVRAARVVCGAIGDGNNGGDEGRLFDGDDGEQQEDNTRDGDDTTVFSFSAVEDELLSRSAAKTTAPGDGAGDGADGESGWWPRFFPPREDGDVVQPLVELPLDGVLLQLFPALLIGVVGLFLTIAVQVETSRFDGMVGDDGGAVVVTDLRDTTTTTAEPQP